MYRAVAWMATHEGLALDDEPAVSALAERVELALDDQTVRVEGHDVTRAIRTGEIDAAAARVARMALGPGGARAPPASLRRRGRPGHGGAATSARPFFPRPT